jgi:hypothetical protein
MAVTIFPCPNYLGDPDSVDAASDTTLGSHIPEGCPLLADSRPSQYGFSSSLNDSLQQELTFKMKYPENPSPNGRFTHESSRQADSMVTGGS